MRTAVVGLGNPIVADDRVGLAVAEELRRLLRESPVEQVDVLTATRGGLELIDLLSGYERAILVDCMVVTDPCPGRVQEFTLDNVASSARLVNAHEASIADVFRLAATLGLPMPASVEIFGVEAGDAVTVSEQMTPAVAAAVAPLARRIHALLAVNPRESGAAC